MASPGGDSEDVHVTAVEGRFLTADQLKQEPEEDFSRSLQNALAITRSSDSSGDEDDDDDDDDEEEGEEEEEGRGEIDFSSVDSESTMRYLRGDLSFEEFQSLLESQQPVKVQEVGEELVTTEQEAPAARELTGLEKARLAKKKKRGVNKSKLPKYLLGLMGEANMKFALGEYEEAVKMCMEVIRIVPKAHEPFQTLGMLYEELGDSDKAIQFMLISAHLNPKDHEEWVRLADLSLENNNLKQAVSCYDKAIKHAPTNMVYMWARCDLLEKMGDKKRALEGYQQILNVLPKENGEKYMILARDMIKTFHSNGDTAKALATMMSAFDEHPELVIAEDVNLFLELLLAQSSHKKCVEVLVQHCGVTIVYKNEDVLSGAPDEPVELKDEMPENVVVPDQLPIDLRAKLIICLIHLDYKMCIPGLMAIILTEGPSEIGDLYLDIAEAYMETGEYEGAEPILQQLVHSENYKNLGAVWLRYAECLNPQGKLAKAVEAYSKVVQLAPGHMAARVSLSALQQQLGRYDDALQTLDHADVPTEGDSTPLDIRLCMPKCMLLYSQKRWKEFLTVAALVLFGHFRDIFERKHLNVILTSRSMKHRVQAMRVIFGSEVESVISSKEALLPDDVFSIEDIWELYLKVCNVLRELNKLDELETITIVALMNPHFMHHPLLSKEADFMCLTACLLNQNGAFAYNFVRDLCLKQPNNNRAWNLFGQLVVLSQDLRHMRFVLRLLLKWPDHLPCAIINGNSALVAGSYKHAVGEYVTALRMDPSNPMLSLLVGCSYISISCQKFALHKHSVVIQGLCFLNQYLEQRGECQETFYNMGRAMHQLGLVYSAVHYYEKALKLKPAVEDSEGIFDLRYEIAFNLSLIYRQSGNTDMANMILQKYMVI